MKKENQNIKFPKDFLWGVATSAYQIEGGIKNDWSEWEASEERVRHLKQVGQNPSDFVSGKADNSYMLWKDDLACLKQLNVNAYRLGIEWARIEPEKGKIDQKAVKYYQTVLADLQKNGIKVFLTLWHYTLPTWVRDQGGWASRKTIDDFVDFTELAVQYFGKNIDYYITMNEPMIIVADGYMVGKNPPNKKNPLLAKLACMHMIKAHRLAYVKIHELDHNAKVGIAQMVNYFEPARKWCLPEWLLVKMAHYFWNHRFLKKINKHMDFVGVNYYFHDCMVWHPPFVKNENKQVTDMGWEIYPKGIYHVLKYAAKFKKPIFVLENGLADREDKHRPMFIKNHLSYIHQAIKEGAPVKGYFHWSLMDNFEWARGYDPKFGLFAVDFKTFKRSARPSAREYAKIIKNNSI